MIRVKFLFVCKYEDTYIESVDCIAGSTIRLVGGPAESAGRLEVLHNGQWGTVCDDSFDSADGSVVCRQLGYPGFSTVNGLAYFGEGNGTIWMDDVKCTGNEADIEYCFFDGWGVNDCRHAEDVGVVCSKSNDDRLRVERGTDNHTSLVLCVVLSGGFLPFAVRLVDGSGASEGRVEVNHKSVLAVIRNKHGHELINLCYIG